MWRKLILVVPVLWLLGGCANLGTMVESALALPTGVLTTSIDNPVTTDHLYRFENGLIAGTVALSKYKEWCNLQSVGHRCDKVVVTLQSYVRRARPLLKQLRVFVRKNDQVNAKVVFTTVKALIDEVRAIGAAEGVAIPAM